MSARYSSSPALRLAIAESRQYRCLLLLLALAAFFALFLLYQRGYPQFVLLFSPLAVISLVLLRDQAPGGWVLHWRQGEWSLERDGSVSMIEVLPDSVNLGWVTCLVYTRLPDGRCNRAWIFADSCDRKSLRRLRVRLTLQR